MIVKVSFALFAIVCLTRYFQMFHAARYIKFSDIFFLSYKCKFVLVKPTFFFSKNIIYRGANAVCLVLTEQTLLKKVSRNQTLDQILSFVISVNQEKLIRSLL